MSANDGGYVHEPGAFDADGNRVETGDDESEDADWLESPTNPESVDREFGWRGWVLVGVILVAFVGSPLAILLWPPTLNYWVALLVLPLVPAVLLALTAVWATMRP
ncbi:hypothetical protein [Natronobiforma cellulositropha]|uniref:hypothetical protein n=1 Tax=Natronobiforma cellulositropha TaxID=1679076 RepID=UPI0021D60E12|nr:hypothetical protein [Natronobiforma cellulositropha]